MSRVDTPAAAVRSGSGSTSRAGSGRGSGSGYTVERVPVFRRWDYALYLALTVLAAATGAWVLRSWSRDRVWGHEPVIGAALSALLLVSVAMYAARWLTLPLMRRPVHRDAAPGWRVGVATTFVPGAEPLEMLAATVEALVAMDYPHETWVLDEGDAPEVRELCARLGAGHFTRKHADRYLTDVGHFEARTKHGNYNAWLDAVGYDRYDIVVNFDPDHIPEPWFLDRVLGYFDDPGIGYVQAPQIYYNQQADFIAGGAAEETYAYYSSIQLSSYGLDYPIVTGCHTAQRVDALREVGGFAPHEADDLLITLFYRAARWRGVYVPENLAQGLVPVDWPGYLNQQRRWARSVLDVKFRWFPGIARRLGRVERVVGFCHGLHYLNGLGTAAGIAVLSYLLATGTPVGAFSGSVMLRALALMGALQACEFYRQRFFLDPRREVGVHLRSGFLRMAKWPSIVLALGDVVRARHHAYLITRKTGAVPEAGGGARRAAPGGTLWRPHVATAALISVAWLVGSLHGVFRSPALQLGAAALVVSSLAVAASALRAPPDPFDAELARHRRRPQRPPSALP